MYSCTVVTVNLHVRMSLQVTVSYLLKGTQNLILLSNATFSEEKDPTRFFSYHCLLYPQTRWCNDVRL